MSTLDTSYTAVPPSFGPAYPHDGLSYPYTPTGAVRGGYLCACPTATQARQIYEDPTRVINIGPYMGEPVPGYQSVYDPLNNLAPVPSPTTMGGQVKLVDLAQCVQDAGFNWNKLRACYDGAVNQANDQETDWQQCFQNAQAIADPALRQREMQRCWQGYLNDLNNNNNNVAMRGGAQVSDPGIVSGYRYCYDQHRGDPSAMLACFRDQTRQTLTGGAQVTPAPTPWHKTRAGMFTIVFLAALAAAGVYGFINRKRVAKQLSDLKARGKSALESAKERVQTMAGAKVSKTAKAPARRRRRVVRKSKKNAKQSFY